MSSTCQKCRPKVNFLLLSFYTRELEPCSLASADDIEWTYYNENLTKSCKAPDLSSVHATNTSIKRQNFKWVHHSSLSHPLRPLNHTIFFPVENRSEELKNQDFPPRLLLPAQASRQNPREKAQQQGSLAASIESSRATTHARRHVCLVRLCPLLQSNPPQAKQTPA